MIPLIQTVRDDDIYESGYEFDFESEQRLVDDESGYESDHESDSKPDEKTITQSEMVAHDLDLQYSSVWRLMYVHSICKDDEYEISVEIGNDMFSGSDDQNEIRLYGNSVNGGDAEKTEWLQLRKPFDIVDGKPIHNFNGFEQLSKEIYCVKFVKNNNELSYPIKNINELPIFKPSWSEDHYQNHEHQIHTIEDSLSDDYQLHTKINNLETKIEIW